MTRARANAMLVAATTAAVLAGLVGCGPAGEDAVEAASRRGAGEAETARLNRQLEVLEARLLDGRARVQGWCELRDRQRRVAAEASEGATWHLADVLQAREAEQLLVRAIQAPRLAAAGVADAGTRSP